MPLHIQSSRFDQLHFNYINQYLMVIQLPRKSKFSSCNIHIIPLHFLRLNLYTVFVLSISKISPHMSIYNLTKRSTRVVCYILVHISLCIVNITIYLPLSHFNHYLLIPFSFVYLCANHILPTTIFQKSLISQLSFHAYPISYHVYQSLLTITKHYSTIKKINSKLKL